MHASLHTLAHRAPPATRTRVRWQPYSSISSTTSSCSKSPASQISTPVSSISSPVSNTPHPDSLRIKQPIPPTQTQNKEPQPKIKHAIGLVDQAVKTLSEIWRPQDVPSAFLYSSKAGLTASGSLESINHPPSSLNRIAGCVPSSISQPSNDVPGNLVPIKGFVHEVIRRSRTSGCVLQTALCYIEAIRSQVPELVRKEQSGQSTHTEPDISIRIMPASESDMELDQYLCMEAKNCADQTDTSVGAFLVPTVRISDIEESSSFPSDPSSYSNGISAEQSTSSTPTLPSPLLCPRRTFLAALILASKFMQDKCYSNRAWAKLSGLPAREIGRCERTLGEALEWRLWVGKTTVQSQATTPPNNPSTRPIVRSQSENNILSSPTRPFLVRPSDVVQPVVATNGQKLRRSSTMPTEEFAFANSSRGIDLPAEIQQFIMARLKCNQSSPDDIQFTPLGATVQASYVEVLCQSPSPENPGLSYSPSSTESSSGERTIQMNTFIDEPMSCYSQSQGASAVEVWPWSDTNDSHEGFKISPIHSFTANSKVLGPNEYPNLLAYRPQELLTGHLVRDSTNTNIAWDPEGETIRPIALSAT